VVFFGFQESEKKRCRPLIYVSLNEREIGEGGKEEKIGPQAAEAQGGREEKKKGGGEGRSVVILDLQESTQKRRGKETAHIPALPEGRGEKKTIPCLSLCGLREEGEKNTSDLVGSENEEKRRKRWAFGFLPVEYREKKEKKGKKLTQTKEKGEKEKKKGRGRVISTFVLFRAREEKRHS